MAFAINSDIKEIYEYTNYSDYRNNLVKNFTGADYGDIYTFSLIRPKIAKSKAQALEYKYNSKLFSNNKYIGIKSLSKTPIFKKIVYSKNGTILKDMNPFKYHDLSAYTLYIDKKLSNEDFNIFIYIDDDYNIIEAINNIEVYSVNERTDVLRKYYNKLKENSYDIEKISNSHFKISGNFSKDNTIITTTIPYDDNLHIKIDGKETKTIKVAGALLGFSINKGFHNVDIKYIPKGILSGILLSVISVLILLFMQFNRKEKREAND